MELCVNVLVHAVFTVFTIHAVLGAPPSGLTVVEGGIGGTVIDGGNKVSENSFKIGSNIYYNTIKCTQTVTIAGNGVLDYFDLPCGNSNELTAVGTKTFALYKNTKEKLTLFTNTPSLLIILEDKKCSKRDYTTINGITTYKVSNLSKGECKKATKGIEDVEKILQKGFEDKTRETFTPCSPFCDSGNHADGESSFKQNQIDSDDMGYLDDWVF